MEFFNSCLISGIISSTISMALAFFTFSVALPTEEEPVPITRRSGFEVVNNVFIAIVVILVTPCILIQMSLIAAYMGYASFFIFVFVGVLALFTNPHSTFNCCASKRTFKAGLLKIMTNMFVPVTRYSRKLNLFK